MFNRVIIAAAASAFITVGANAQTVGIGSTKGSMVAAMTTAISKLVSEKSVLKMRRQEMGGTQKYIPVVDAGELEFGLSNIVQYTMAKEGRDLSRQKYENLQLVSTLMRFHTGLLVKNNSSIRKVEDLRGKRVPAGFKGAPLFEVFFTAFLANAGLTWNDVVKVPAVGLAQSWNLFKQGKVDTVIAGVGGGPNKDMNAKIPSGVRYLSFNTGTAQAAKAQAALKGGRWEEVQKRKNFVAVRSPSVVLFGYDFTMFTHKNVPVDTVYAVTKAMHASVKDLHGISGIWRSYNEKRMATDQGVAYHAGAVKFYKEKGLWKR